jgi:hypothetical protein
MQYGIETRGARTLPRRLVATGLVLAIAATGIALAAPPEATAAKQDEKSPAELEKMIQELREQLRKLSDGRDDEMEALKKRLEELEAELRKERADRDDELAAILEDAEEATAEEKKKEKNAEKERESFEGRQRSLQKMNPEISFVGDFSVDWAGSDELRNQFTLRGVELALQAPLDPYTRFKAYFGAHQHPAEIEIPGEEHEHGEIFTAVEEAYMEWVALPLNTQVMVGKFRQQFGTLNRWHKHALPTVDSPFALRDTFGMEGLNSIGVSGGWLFPEVAKTTPSLEIQITNADNDIVFAGGEFQDPSYLLRPSAFVDLGPGSYIEVGVTGMTGPNDEEDDRTDLGSVDLNFIWEPVHRAKYRNVEVRGEYIYSNFEETDETTGVQDSIVAHSWYLYAYGRVSRRWIVGLRYDDAELPSPRWPLIDPAEFREGLREKAWTPFITFWQSEYVRLRFQYQHATRNFVGLQGPMDDDRAWIQVTWAAGPHKHESY